MALPRLTPEQRQANLEKAAASRRERAEIKNRLKHSGASIVDVLQQGQENEVIGKMQVVDLLQSMPGVGKVRARQMMERLEHLREPSRARPRRQPDRRARARVRVAWLSRDCSRHGPARRSWRVRRRSARARWRRTSARHHPEVWISVSATTRPPRPGEVHGRHYWFVTDEEFDRLIADGRSCWSGRSCTRRARYGTPRRPVEEALAAGRPGAARDRPAGRPPGPGDDAGGAVRLPQAAVLGGAGAPAGRPGHRDRGGAEPAGWRPRGRSWRPRRSST